MSIPYYRWFPGDYARDTRHLSLMQHGVYSLLIDLYMDQGGPLRNDLPYLYRWLHAESVEEKHAVEFVLSEFFLLTDNRWNHKRCNAEIDWRSRKSVDARKSAGKRWNNASNANAMRTHSERNANQNQNQNQSKSKNTCASPSVNARAFAQFWAIYPKKRSKGQAEKAWNALKPDTELIETILGAVELAKQSAEWVRDGGQFIPHPSTWLNAKGWEDDLVTINASRRLAV